MCFNYQNCHQTLLCDLDASFTRIFVPLLCMRILVNFLVSLQIFHFMFWPNDIPEQMIFWPNDIPNLQKWFLLKPGTTFVVDKYDTIMPTTFMVFFILFRRTINSQFLEFNFSSHLVKRTKIHSSLQQLAVIGFVSLLFLTCFMVVLHIFG